MDGVVEYHDKGQYMDGVVEYHDKGQYMSIGCQPREKIYKRPFEWGVNVIIQRTTEVFYSITLTRNN